MKAAINFRRISAALGRKAVGLAGHSQRKAQRLLKRGPASSPERCLGESKPYFSDRTSLSETIQLAQQGDAAAFELIYRLHCGRVYALCLRMLRDPVEAEDLAQEVFIRLFRKIHTFRGESAFSTWLHRLAINVVLMRLRKKSPMSTSLDGITGSDEEDGRPHNEIGGPDLWLGGLADRVSLQAAVDQLPEGYRAIFILYDVQGYEHSEIAGILGCSIGNSKSQLHKARKRLRELLQEVQGHGARETRETSGHSLAVASSC